MPKDDSTKPQTNNQVTPTTSLPPVPATDMSPVFMEETTPPMMSSDDLPVANVTAVTPPVVGLGDDSTNTDSGSAAPSDDIVIQTQPISSNPRKKFAGGKVIATILGLFLLVGGLGAGVMLTQQNQNVSEKAAGCVNDTSGTLTLEEAKNKPVSYCSGATDISDGCNAGQNGTNATIPSDLTTSSCFCGTYQYDSGNNHFSITGTSCGGGGGGNYVCKPDTVNCPPGSTVDYNQPLYNYCRDVHDQGSSCSGPGSAQKETGCCVAAGKEGCGNPQYTTYNCCPADAPSVCTDTTSTYVKTVTWPNAPTVNCFEYDALGNRRDDTYVSHTDTNCREVLNPDGKPARINVCDYSVTCSRVVKTCKCEGGTPPPTPLVTASCQNIKAYSSTWVELTAAQLAALKPTNIVNLCVTGVATGGSFDKAKFTINNVVQAETTTKRPSSEDFCQAYTIPTGTTTFNIVAHIHHVTLGWLPGNGPQ